MTEEQQKRLQDLRDGILASLQGRADQRLIQSDVDVESVAIALRMPTLRDKIACVIDHTAYLGTPEVIYRRRPHESVKDAANRLQIEVLETADEIIALLLAEGLIPEGYR